MTPNLSQTFAQAYRDLRPRSPMPEFEVSFYRFANVNNTIRLRQGRIFVRLSDLLEGAPDSVLYAILHILIAKLYRKPIDAAHAARYRKFTGSHDMAVPRYAVEYIVYHEMLHLRHPVKLRGSRRSVHPPAFQAEEKLFPHLAEAQQFMKHLGNLD
jgi:hypothetical protein